MRVDRSAGPARRRTTILAAVAGASYLAFAPHGAQATVTISSGSSNNIHCTSGVCTPTAANAVLNATHLQNLLASESVKVTTGGRLAYEIVVSAKITWSSSHGLTLYAAHSVKIDEPISVKGNGALDLEAAHGAGGELSFGANGFVTFSGLSNKLTVHGDSFKLVNSVASLASAVSANPNGNYALAKSYNAAPDGTYAASPIKKDFNGIFEGLGNTISNLSITDTHTGVFVALFSDLNLGGTIRRINFENVSIKGATNSAVGGIVARSDGFMKLNTVSGQITTGASGIAGGMVGINEGPIRSSHASATVKAGANSGLGGLTGYNYDDITSSYATGTVTGGNGSDAGGLIGNQQSNGVVTDCHAGGAVTMTGNAGSTGGLIGYGASGTLTTSYATGAVKGGGSVGGLVGYNDRGMLVQQSYATGTVTAVSIYSAAGGLIGNNQGSIGDSYAMGAVSGDHLAGGLVGANQAQIATSYSSGKVANSGTRGGLIGADQTVSGYLTNDYWDTTTSTVVAAGRGAGTPANDPGITGLTTAQLQSALPTGFSSTVWRDNPSVNGGLPYLTAQPPN
jgi:hypothetical protein